jgi:hypothetical protein
MRLYTPINEGLFTVDQMAKAIKDLQDQFNEEVIDGIDYRQMTSNWAAAIINKNGNAGFYINNSK